LTAGPTEADQSKY